MPSNSGAIQAANTKASPMDSPFSLGGGAHVPDYMIAYDQWGGRLGTYRIISDHPSTPLRAGPGSVRLVVDVASGAIAQRIDYDEFGRVLQNTNPGFQPFGFAGGMQNHLTVPTQAGDMEVGAFVHFGARDYDPFTGRWTGKDPILFDGGDPNIYAYCGNDPVNCIDIDGKNPFILIGAVIGAAVSGAQAYSSGARGWELALQVGVGALSGATAGSGVGLIGSIGAGALAAGLGNLTSQNLEKVFGRREEVDIASAGLSAIAGAYGGIFGGGLVKAVPDAAVASALLGGYVTTATDVILQLSLKNCSVDEVSGASE
ncbi:MAG: RHS repeat-associated core domain-containing protein [Chrysiogenetes bacterium]|nr:RHS repeat-associated core domain-containing protein [Chrysiogenetes bacterium]